MCGCIRAWLLDWLIRFLLYRIAQKYLDLGQPAAPPKLKSLPRPQSRGRSKSTPEPRAQKRNSTPQQRCPINVKYFIVWLHNLLIGRLGLSVCLSESPILPAGLSNFRGSGPILLYMEEKGFGHGTVGGGGGGGGAGRNSHIIRNCVATRLMSS